MTENTAITAEQFLVFVDRKRQIGKEAAVIGTELERIASEIATIQGYRLLRGVRPSVKDLTAMPQTTVFFIDEDDLDCLFSVEFPTEYLWTPNWKDIEIKKEQDLRLAKAIEQEAAAESAKKQAEEDEYKLFLVLKQKYEGK